MVKKADICQKTRFEKKWKKVKYPTKRVINEKVLRIGLATFFGKTTMLLGPKTKRAKVMKFSHNFYEILLDLSDNNSTWKSKTR